MAPSLAASSSQFCPHLPYLISARRRTPPRHHYAAKSQPRMDLLGRSTACRVWSPPPTCSSSPLLRPRCSRDDPRPPPDNRGDDEDSRLSTDWDKAWSNFKKRGKKSLFSQFKPDKYVTWNPRRSEYPLSEEIDPIKRTERSNLVLWTSPKFTLIGAAVIVSLLLVYTLVAPLK